MVHSCCLRRKWYCLNRTNVDVLKPRLYSVLVVVESDTAIGWTHHEELVFNFEYIDGWLNHIFLHCVYFIVVAHQIDLLYRSSFFWLCIVFHDEGDIPDDDKSISSARYGLISFWNKHSLSEDSVHLRRTIVFESLFSCLPAPENESSLASSHKLILVIVKFNESLQALHSNIHQIVNVSWLVIFPPP